MRSLEVLHYPDIIADHKTGDSHWRHGDKIAFSSKCSFLIRPDAHIEVRLTADNSLVDTFTVSKGNGAFILDSGFAEIEDCICCNLPKVKFFQDVDDPKYWLIDFYDIHVNFA